MTNIFHDATEEGRESRDLARAEEGEGMVLNGCGPVGGVRIERMEEMVLDPIQGRRGGVSIANSPHRDSGMALTGGSSLIDQSISNEHAIYLRAHVGVQGGGRIVSSGRWHLDGRGRGGILAGHGEGETSEEVHQAGAAYSTGNEAW